MNEDLKKKIEDIIAQDKVVLFMKGTPQFPQCGFSARAVAILNELGASFASFNVFDDENVRQGIKEFSNWPTIPQLYIDKKLIGGSDIMLEMYETGEFKELL
tara:strand:- start:158 stop:463 length:306 start_codon:yes stop_codon:yes gene_type:complete